MDHHNRLKAAFDGLSKCIDIDDCYFFAGNIEKVEGSQESITFVISTMVPRNEDQIETTWTHWAWISYFKTTTFG